MLDNFGMYYGWDDYGHPIYIYKFHHMHAHWITQSMPEWIKHKYD